MRLAVLGDEQPFVWAKPERRPSREDVQRAVADDGIVCAIIDRFDSLIGLWPDDHEDQ